MLRLSKLAVVGTLCTVAVLLVVELLRILWATDGVLIYTLDDPYIHLALAEQLLQGAYGVNPGEVSAPSSSILWPFLMAAMGAWEYAPLMVNVAAALATTWIFTRIVPAGGFAIGLVLLLVACTNVIGLVFTGMEHSLQVLVTVAIAYGLWRASSGERPWWLPMLLIAAPLIRYELLAITVPSVVLLWWWGQRRSAIGSVLGTIIGVGGFSLFLMSIGMGALPTSIHVKSAVVESSGALHQLFLTFRENLKQRQAVVLLVGAVVACVRPQRGPQRGLWLAVVGAVLLHLLVGQFGWFYRYEAYIMAWVATLLVVLYRDHLASVVGDVNVWMRSLAAALLLLAAGAPYIQGLAALPGASANIYLQQYQMHRFVSGWWKDDVAVNDIGWVSYRNEHHVLDLWGLSSRKALQMRSQSADTTLQWMDDLVLERNIGLVMLYEDWFGGVPTHWTLVGTMHMDRPRVTSTRDYISFYATTSADVARIRRAMESFGAAVPDGARIELEPAQ